MEDLIKALQILLKYGNPAYPTHCEHDVLHICGIDVSSVTAGDRDALERLGFYFDEGNEEAGFYSFKYGSA